MARPWQKQATLLNQTNPQGIAQNIKKICNFKLDIISSNMQNNEMQPQPTSSPSAVGQSISQSGLQQSSLNPLQTANNTTATSDPLSRNINSTVGTTSPYSRLGTGMNSMYGGMGGGYGRYGMGGGLGMGMGGYGMGMGMGMNTGNKFMDQMNQYVYSISQMAGMVQQNASGLAKFILLMKKMLNYLQTNGKEMLIKGYYKAIQFLQKIKQFLKQKYEWAKYKIGIRSANNDDCQLQFDRFYYPQNSKLARERQRDQLEKQIKFIDYCTWFIIGVVILNLARIVYNYLQVKIFYLTQRISK